MCRSIKRTDYETVCVTICSCDNCIAMLFIPMLTVKIQLKFHQEYVKLTLDNYV